MGVIVLVRIVDVAWRADRNVELLVRPNGDEFPAVRLVLRELVVDEDRLRRVVEVVLDGVEARDLGQLGDVERALVELTAVDVTPKLRAYGRTVMARRTFSA